MTRFRNLAIGCFVVVLVATIPAARADPQEHRTAINVPYAVQVDQIVLQPGAYIIRQPELSAGVNLVQILSSDEKTIVATIQGINVTRQRTTGKTEFWFWKTPRGKPRVVRAWFYPGEELGVEVVSKHQAAGGQRASK
jgi:hypothetical protein